VVSRHPTALSTHFHECAFELTFIESYPEKEMAGHNCEAAISSVAKLLPLPAKWNQQMVSASRVRDQWFILPGQVLEAYNPSHSWP
jgi:hypothetical protein